VPLSSLGITLRPTREGCALAAVVLIGFGSAVAYGRYQPYALAAIVVGAGIALFGSSASRLPSGTSTWSLAAFAGAISSGFLVGSSPVDWLGPVAGGIGAILVISARGRLLRIGGCVVAVTTSLLIVAKDITWGRAAVDVFTFTQRATQQLLLGRDPYGFAYPTTTPHLPLAHYFYLPGVLLLSIPGRLLGDIRVSCLLAAVALVGAITLLARRHGGSEQGWRCLALCLTLPFFPLMVLYGWTEIYPITGIALWLVLRERHRISSVLVLGVGVATVPTALPLLVLPFLWWRQARLEILGAALVAATICLPFAIWTGAGNFVYATLLLNLHLPPSTFGLDLDAAYQRFTGTWMPNWIWPLVVAVSLVLLARAKPRTWPRAFYLGSALLAVAFLWAKWAIFNYYFLVVVGLVLALALTQSGGGVSPLGAQKPGPARSLGAEPELEA